MANNYGYMQVKTDRPGFWEISGEVVITDGYGAPSYPTVPSGVVDSVVHNSTGNYSILLKQNWVDLLDCHVASQIASGSPTFAFSQLVSNTVGQSGYGSGPGQTKQSVTFKFVNGSGTAVELPSGSSFFFTLILKNSTA